MNGNYKQKKIRAEQHNKNYEASKRKTGNERIITLVDDMHEKANQELTTLNN